MKFILQLLSLMLLLNLIAANVTALPAAQPVLGKTNQISNPTGISEHTELIYAREKQTHEPGLKTLKHAFSAGGKIVFFWLFGVPAFIISLPFLILGLIKSFPANDSDDDTTWVKDLIIGGGLLIFSAIMSIPFTKLRLKGDWYMKDDKEYNGNSSKFKEDLENHWHK